ncbi:carboxymuconolactone decarboxylase family protein [Muricoccus vinaceus]|uniref:Carboxymuconolactone decarboxylase family protein n=1 Tax=Muricoccus vinaceus TaxID=424704 RepID=A0ABV6IPL2_9PROT
MTDGAGVSGTGDDRDAAEAARVRESLLSLRDSRGYVLPHRGLMAAALPELHAAYGAMYRALTVQQGQMPPLERECVWLAILVSCDEPVGTHHLALFRQHGGDDQMAAALFRQTAWAIGAEAHAFLPRSWGPHFPGLDAAALFRDGAAALATDGVLPDTTARLLRLAVLAARGNLWALGVELEAAYAAGLDERRMAEAVSLIIWPRGVNPFVRAADTWLALLRSGRVRPGAAFAAWAEAGEQGPLVLEGGGDAAPRAPAE